MDDFTTYGNTFQEALDNIEGIDSMLGDKSSP